MIRAAAPLLRSAALALVAGAAAALCSGCPSDSRKHAPPPPAPDPAPVATETEADRRYREQRAERERLRQEIDQRLADAAEPQQQQQQQQNGGAGGPGDGSGPHRPEVSWSLTRTPGGVPVYVPDWLDGHPDLVLAALAEVDATEIEGTGDTLLDRDPATWPAAVVIGDPEGYPNRSSPTGIAAGHYDVARAHCWSAWTLTGNLTPGDRRRLRALGHELGHHYDTIPRD